MLALLFVSMAAVAVTAASPRHTAAQESAAQAMGARVAAAQHRAAQSPAGGRDVVLLLASETLGGSARAATLLQGMCDGTDVLGAVRFEARSLPGAWPADGGAAVDGRTDLRTVIAIVGDGALLPGVDPNAPPRPADVLISRDIDADALAHSLVDLRRSVAATGADLVLCSAPLGMQGRVEMPELLAARAVVLADSAKGSGSTTLDLGGHFEGLERSPMFADGIDTLDDFGHDELARVLWRAILAEDSPLAPRDDSERAARAEARAFLALYDGDLDAFEEQGRALMSVEGPTRGSNMRRAIFGTALDKRRSETAHSSHGEPTGTKGDDRWYELIGRYDLKSLERPPEVRTAGVRLAAFIATAWDDQLSPTGGIEPEIIRVLAGTHLYDDVGGARDRAEALVDEHPHRIEAWAALQFAWAFHPPLRDRRAEALGHLEQFTRGAANIRAARKVFDAWPMRMRWLPALIAASHPYAEMTPTGPLLDNARRRSAAAGLFPAPGRVLREQLAKGRFPRAWHREAERLSQH